MPVVDFHLHCYDRPLRAPDSFVAFMDRELAKTHFPDLERVSDKVLFGSDRPTVPTLKGNIEAIRTLPLSERARERILGGNAARILGLT